MFPEDQLETKYVTVEYKDGKPVSVRAGDPLRQVLAYYKPIGEVTSHRDPEPDR